MLSTVEAYDRRITSGPRKAPCPTSHVLDGQCGKQPDLRLLRNPNVRLQSPDDSWTAKAVFSRLVGADVQRRGWDHLPVWRWTADLHGAYDFALAYDPAQDQFTARRKMPRTRSAAGCAVIDGRIYLVGGCSKEPIVNLDAIYYTVVDVFSPQGGVTPQILSLTCESTNQVRLVWQGEAGISYGSSPGRTSPQALGREWRSRPVSPSPPPMGWSKPHAPFRQETQDVSSASSKSTNRGFLGLVHRLWLTPVSTAVPQVHGPGRKCAHGEWHGGHRGLRTSRHWFAAVLRLAAAIRPAHRRVGGFTGPGRDGHNNWQEWRCQTDPTNALSSCASFPPRPRART